ncbi:hypothetical protein [Microcoleus sp. Pol12A5]|uniref:hypothetical protein n=1 Tax=Microcoleus sp. Pol12A5 TaxID=3055392 RepID=UPI002FD74D70
MLYLVQLKLEGKAFFAYRDSNGVWDKVSLFSHATTQFKTQKGAWDALKRVPKYCNESGYDSLQKAGYEIDVIGLTESDVQAYICEEEQRSRASLLEDNKRKISRYGREAEKQVMEFFLSSTIGTQVRIYKRFSFDWEVAQITNINLDRFEAKNIEFELLTGRSPEFLALPPDDEVSEAIISQQLLEDFTANYWKWKLTPKQQIAIAKILTTFLSNS